MNQDETRAFRPLIKNGKYFVQPTDTGSDFKKLFRKMASVGAGRPVDKDGFPVGQWTPELLADAISRIEANRDGIDLRTVQHWFQENDKGISADNIRWLSRIFGCGEPDASGAWQVELNAANRRLAAKRKKKKASGQPQPGSTSILEQVGTRKSPENHPPVIATGSSLRFNLAKGTETLFGGNSSMALPLVVFTGACALGLISFTLNIHSVVHTLESGSSKQVGFLWAPNWTITFLAVLPLFLALVIDLLSRWKEEWRPRIAECADPALPAVNWELRLTAASKIFWATFFVTVIIASGYNWAATHLVPLLKGDPGGWAMDWGRIAIIRPDLISVQGAIAFTGLVFLFNGFTAYVFFSGLIFLHLMKHDYVNLMKDLDSNLEKTSAPEIEGISLSLMMGIFRCASSGIVITILMKLQSSYLQSDSINMVDWLIADSRSLFEDQASFTREIPSLGIAPGNYYSFFCLLAIAGTFMNASISLGRMVVRLHEFRSRSRFHMPWVAMNGTMALLVIGYFMIGVLPGFSVFLLISLALLLYLLVKPVSAWSRCPRMEGEDESFRFDG